jgi:hypothetical protein
MGVMRHIPRAHDEVELEREVLHNMAFVIRDSNMVSTQLRDVIDLGVGRGEGVDLGAEGVGEGLQSGPIINGSQYCRTQACTKMNNNSSHGEKSGRVDE